MSCIQGGFLFKSHSENLFLDQNNRIVARLSSPDVGIYQVNNCGYVFLHRPLNVGESFAVRIHAFQEQSNAVFGFGMTSCNPERLKVSDLPDDCDLLSDRSEYWVIDRTRFLDLRPGDELHFLYVDGEILGCKNDQKPVSVMFVDRTIPLWPFFELGNIAELKLLDQSSYLTALLPISNRALSVNSGIRQTSANKTGGTSPQTQPPKSSSVKILPTQGRKKPAPPVPPRPTSKINPTPQSPPPPLPQTSTTTTVLASAMNGQKSRPSSAKVDPKVSTKAPTPVGSQSTKLPWKRTKNIAPPPPTSPSVVNHRKESSRDPKETSSADECLMCMEREIDCVLYTCGHMCLCFECATELRNSAKFLCPVCRKDIADVIRTFKP